MLRHERKHTGEKPFSCLFDNCDRTFSRYDNLMPHFRNHFGFGKTQDGGKAEEEIPLLRTHSVEELKKMSKEKRLRMLGTTPLNASSSTDASAGQGSPDSVYSSSSGTQNDDDEEEDNSLSMEDDDPVDTVFDQPTEVPNPGRTDPIRADAPARVTPGAFFMPQVSAFNVLGHTNSAPATVLQRPAVQNFHHHHHLQLDYPRTFTPSSDQFDRDLINRFRGPL